MAILELFAYAHPAAIATGDLLLMIVLWRAGRAWERAHARLDDDTRGANLRSASQSFLALFGLLQAFSFGAAYAKFESRRMATVAEANAISTVATRLQLLPDEERTPAMELLRRIVELHHPLGAPARTREERRAVDREIRELQRRLSDRLTVFMRTSEGTPLIVALAPPLDAMTDQYEARVEDVVAKVPGAVLLLLLLSSAICAFVVGLAEGHSHERTSRVTLAFLALTALVLGVTLDLDQPFTGLSRESDLPMRRLSESLGGRQA